jgi:hypothetical protein
MQNQEFELTGEYIALCDLLKLAGIVSSGGEGKVRVARGDVPWMVSPSCARRPRSGPARWWTATA